MDLISPEQCRAARALLNWSQPDLADKCDMHVQTISSFENGNGIPTKTTLKKITEIFENNEISFLKNNGVCIEDKELIVLKRFIDVLADIDKTLTAGQEVVLDCADEKRNTLDVTKRLSDLHKKGINIRFNLSEGDTFHTLPAEHYRQINKDYFANSQVTVTYGNRHVVHVQGDADDSFLIIKNQDLANSMRKRFNFLWKNGKEIPKGA